MDRDTDLRVFEQGADIFTNDPDHQRLHFTVAGQVVDPIEFEPAVLAVSKVAGEDRVYDVRVASAKFADPRDYRPFVRKPGDGPIVRRRSAPAEPPRN